MEKNQIIVGYNWTKGKKIRQCIFGLLLMVGTPLAVMQEGTANQPFFQFLVMLCGAYLLKQLWTNHRDYDVVKVTVDEISFELRYDDKVECFKYPLSELVAIEYFQLLQPTNYDQKSYYRDRTLLFKDTNTEFFQKWEKLSVNKRTSFKFKNNDVVQIRTAGSRYVSYVPSELTEITEFLDQNGISVADHLIEKE